MKLQPPVSQNYCATVVKVNSLVPIAGADNITSVPMFGMSAVVGIDTKVGDVGVFFPAECQLSDEYCKENYLYRHENLNKDPSKKGYLDDNRRVRAIKLRGHLSSGLFMPLDSLTFTGVSVADFSIGDQFDTLGGVEICRKYVTPMRGGRQMQQIPKKEQRVDARFMPEHFETPQFLREVEHLDPSTPVVITQKLHGTSIRIGNVPVRRSLSLLERVARLVGVRVSDTEFDNVYGSRKVIKDANNPAQQHYYNTDIWSTEGKKLDDVVPQGYIVYGELIGWTPDGAAIQAHYTYQKPPKTCELYVYRVTFVNAQGIPADLSWDGVREFCVAFGLKHVPELMRSHIGRLTEIDGNFHVPFYEELLDVKFAEWQRESKSWAGRDGLVFADDPVPLSADSPCDEGICIRAEGIIPRIWKVKSPVFLGHETKMLDVGDSDLESEESIVEEPVNA